MMGIVTTGKQRRSSSTILFGLTFSVAVTTILTRGVAAATTYAMKSALFKEATESRRIFTSSRAAFIPASTVDACFFRMGRRNQNTPIGATTTSSTTTTINKNERYSTKVAFRSSIYHPSSSSSYSYSTTTSSCMLLAKPKSGNIVDSYQTVSVNCSKCGTRLFRYKKKNGTKSNLVKCYIERIAEDSAGLLSSYNDKKKNDDDDDDFQWNCPNCNSQFARTSLIHGRPALKIVGGKVRMTKK